MGDELAILYTISAGSILSIVAKFHSPLQVIQLLMGSFKSSSLILVWQQVDRASHRGSHLSIKNRMSSPFPTCQFRLFLNSSQVFSRPFQKIEPFLLRSNFGRRLHPHFYLLQIILHHKVYGLEQKFQRAFIKKAKLACLVDLNPNPTSFFSFAQLVPTKKMDFPVMLFISPNETSTQFISLITVLLGRTDCITQVGIAWTIDLARVTLPATDKVLAFQELNLCLTLSSRNLKVLLPT